MRLSRNRCFCCFVGVRLLPFSGSLSDELWSPLLLRFVYKQLNIPLLDGKVVIILFFSIRGKELEVEEGVQLRGRETNWQKKRRIKLEVLQVHCRITKLNCVIEIGVHRTQDFQFQVSARDSFHRNIRRPVKKRTPWNDDPFWNCVRSSQMFLYLLADWRSLKNRSIRLSQIAFWQIYAELTVMKNEAFSVDGRKCIDWSLLLFCSLAASLFLLPFLFSFFVCGNFIYFDLFL